MGGLGNQLFQIATAYAYAHTHNADLQILQQKLGNDNRPLYWDSILAQFQPFLVDSLPSGLIRFPEREHCATHYTEIPPISPDGIYIEGYRQSPKYFGDIATRNELRKRLLPSADQIAHLKQTYSDLFEHKDRVVVVHARRTDYLHYAGIHGPLNTEYYIRATEEICKRVQSPIFLVCSDDMAYWKIHCDSIPAFKTNTVRFLDEGDDISNFRLLTQFRHYIIANSTFSWWFAWLSDATSVVAPSHWFGPMGPKLYEDVYEHNWIRC